MLEHRLWLPASCALRWTEFFEAPTPLGACACWQAFCLTISWALNLCCFELQDIRQPFLKLLIHVLINSSSLTHQCLQKLVTALLPPPFATAKRDAAELEQCSETMQLQEDIVNTTEQVHSCMAYHHLSFVLCLLHERHAPACMLHQDAPTHESCAVQILLLVPTAMSDLVGLAASCMPHVLRDRATHVLYVRAVLRLALGASGSAVRTGLLTAVMEHLVAMDCEIRWEDIAAHAGAPPDQRA